LQYINSKWFCIGNNGVTFAWHLLSLML
jgi:hypothetical protein